MGPGREGQATIRTHKRTFVRSDVVGQHKAYIMKHLWNIIPSPLIGRPPHYAVVARLELENGAMMIAAPFCMGFV